MHMKNKRHILSCFFLFHMRRIRFSGDLNREEKKEEDVLSLFVSHRKTRKKRGFVLGPHSKDFPFSSTSLIKLEFIIEDVIDEDGPRFPSELYYRKREKTDDLVFLSFSSHSSYSLFFSLDIW